MDAGKRVLHFNSSTSSTLVDANLFTDFALVLLQQVLESSLSLGDASIQPPQQVGLRGRGVVTFDDDMWCCGPEVSPL